LTADGLRSVWAGAVILASGGYAQIFRESTNVPGATGDGVAAAMRAGAVLRGSDTVSTGADGYLKYACPDGSLVEVRANSDLSIASTKALRLERGSLSATVRKQPAGEHMTFTTPHAVATVLGTAPRLSDTFKQEPLAPGKWNKVRWEYAHKVTPAGRPYGDAKLFFNGELIGRRAEYDGDSTRSAGLVLEIIDGPFRFDNVTIRKMKKVGTRTE
jgi:hypothetical protein